MVQLLPRTPVEVAAEWAGIVATLFANQGQAAILGTQGQVAGATKPPTGAGLGELPGWAAGKEDKRAALHWDTSQTVAHCVVGGKATLAIVDTGSYKTIMDVSMARILGLHVREAKGGDCGTYAVPGSGRSNCYAGVVEGVAELQLAPGVVYLTHGLKLIDHPHPLLLVGSDVLSGGRGPGQWNYAGLRLITGAHGAVRGLVHFERDGTLVEEALVNVPTARGSHAAGTGTVNLVQGPPLGGQCLRPDPR
jgi:hypothetical protein